MNRMDDTLTFYEISNQDRDIFQLDYPTQRQRVKKDTALKNLAPLCFVFEIYT